MRINKPNRGGLGKSKSFKLYYTSPNHRWVVLKWDKINVIYNLKIFRKERKIQVASVLLATQPFLGPRGLSSGPLALRHLPVCSCLVKQMQNFKREEQNFVVMNEINNMSFLTADSKSKMSKVSPSPFQEGGANASPVGFWVFSQTTRTLFCPLQCPA